MTPFCMTKINCYFTHLKQNQIKIIKFPSVIFRFIIFHKKMLDREQIKKKFVQNRKAIEGVLKQYKYKQQLKHSENMEVLCSCLESVLDIEDLSEFSRYLCNENHLPIEINFKSLRIQNLEELFEQWLTPKDNTFLMLQRIHSGNFRNILFKAIFLDEKATIDEYFSTISEENKLKSFDLYQLITNLLSSYYLYEYESDSIVFTEKINSFETFIEVVDNFLITNLISLAHKTSSDKFIYRQQFQLLIEHWEAMNHQLTLLDHPRKNIVDFGVQTIINNQVSVETQTNRQKNSSLLNFINNTLHQINIMVQRQDNPVLLKSLNNILEVIRSEKIHVVEEEVSRRRNFEEYDYQEIQYSKVKGFGRKTPTRTPTNKSPSKISLQNNEHHIKKIFDHLCRKSASQYINSSQLQIYFYHLGLVKINQSYLIDNLAKNGFIQYLDQIDYNEFRQIMRQIFRQSSQISGASLIKYIDQHVKPQKIKKSCKNKNEQYYGLFQRNGSSKVLNKSLLNTDNQGF